MIARGNVETMRRAYEAWDAGGVDAMIGEYWDPEIEWHDPPELPDASVYRGLDDVVAYHRGLAEVGEYRIEFSEMVEAGEEDVLVDVQLRGEGTKSGAPVLGEYFALHTLRNGRVRRIQIFFDRAEALAVAEPGAGR